MRTVFMRWPTQVVFGRGTLRELTGHVSRFGVHRALIVTDPGVRRAGIVEMIAAILREASIDYDVFHDVHPDPPIGDVIAGARVARRGGFDTVLGVGGGSAMDTAKAISAYAPLKCSLDLLYGEDRIPGRGLTKFLIPTTGGSGSEISDSCNFSDPDAGEVKRIMWSRHLLADVALIDPALSDHAPPLVTAESGIDALTHAIEAFTCRWASDMSDIWARHALVLAARSLRTAFTEGAAAPQARDDMALAAMLGNAAADIAGLGAVHGLTHGLTARFHISHGRSNALLLPVVMAHNRAVQGDRFRQIATIFSAAELGEAGAADAVARLCAAIDLTGRLRDFGFAQSDLATVAADAIAHFPRHFAANPRDITPEDAAALYRSVW